MARAVAVGAAFGADAPADARAPQERLLRFRKRGLAGAGAPRAQHEPSIAAREAVTRPDGVHAGGERWIPRARSSRVDAESRRPSERTLMGLSRAAALAQNRDISISRQRSTPRCPVAGDRGASGARARQAATDPCVRAWRRRGAQPRPRSASQSLRRTVTDRHAAR